MSSVPKTIKYSNEVYEVVRESVYKRTEQETISIIAVKEVEILEFYATVKAHGIWCNYRDISLTTEDIAAIAKRKGLL